MIVGLGTDIIEIDRIEKSIDRFGESFLRRVLTPAEMETMPQPSASYAAARFAAKEAAVKALGTGFANGITFQHVEVKKLPSGRPIIFFYGPAAERFRELGAERAWVTLTHSREHASAVVILESLP